MEKAASVISPNTEHDIIYIILYVTKEVVYVCVCLSDL